MSLSDTQLVILSAAAQRDDLRITLPERLRGSAAAKVLATLLDKALIEAIPADELQRPAFGEDAPKHSPYRISPAGLAAIGLGGEEAVEEDQPEQVDAKTHKGDASMPSPSETTITADSAGAKPPRTGSKLAMAMALLQRPDGASIDDLTAMTGWLPHTTRAALTGLRKRGITIERSKRADGTTAYRIPAAAELVEAV